VVGAGVAVGSGSGGSCSGGFLAQADRARAPAVARAIARRFIEILLLLQFNPSDQAPKDNPPTIGQRF
jgi:hypothetical protein